mgnify:CR=1 FL=1
MRFLFVWLSIILLSNTAFAQLQGGISGTYFTQSNPEWESAILGIRSNERLLKYGFG